MKPKLVKIDNMRWNPEDIVDVQFDVSTGLDDGYPNAQAGALEVRILKEGTRKPSAQGFELATNKTGKAKFFKAEIQLQDPTEETTYTLKLTDAFVHHWQLDSPEGGGKSAPKVTELLILRCGEASLNGGGVTKNYKLPGWGKSGK